MDPTAIGLRPSPQPSPPPTVERAFSPSSVAAPASLRKRSYDKMRDSDEDADTLASGQPRQSSGFWSRAAEGFARIFGFTPDISSVNNTAAAPEDCGNDGQLAQSEEAATKEKVKPLEDQGTIETVTQCSTGVSGCVTTSRSNTERLRIGIPASDEESIKKLPAHHQLPSPLASEDETPARKTPAQKRPQSKKLGHVSKVEIDGTTTFRFEQPEKPFNPKRRPRRTARQIYESALLRREQAEGLKDTLRRDRQQALQIGTTGRGQIRRPTMGIVYSKTTLRSTPRRPADKFAHRITKPVRDGNGAFRAIERARALGNSAQDILSATLRSLDIHADGFQKLEAVRNRQKEINAEVERIRAEEARRAKEEKRKARREVIRPLHGQELEEATAICREVEAEQRGVQKRDVTYIERTFENPRESIRIGSYILNRVIDPRGWLNDEAVTAYSRLLFERERKRTIIFSPYFFQGMQRSGYNGVKAWARKRGFQGAKILECQYILIPINENGNHWTLAAINPAKKRFEYYNSLNSTKNHPKDVFGRLRNYLQSEVGESLDLGGWTDWVMSDYPQQTNGSDCGIFVLISCEILSRGGIPNYRSGDMQHARIRIVWELANLQLLPVGYGGEDEDE